MQNINEYAKNISFSLYLQLKEAVETGKWLDGNPLDDNQKSHSLQLIMAYQSLNNENPDHFTIAKDGEIYMEKKSALKSKFSNGDTHKLNLE